MARRHGSGVQCCELESMLHICNLHKCNLQKCYLPSASLHVVAHLKTLKGLPGSMEDMVNPFIYGSVVTGEDFVDREPELKDLEMSRRNGKSVVMYSNRRMGKSSLLAEFRRRRGEELHLRVCRRVRSHGPEHLPGEAGQGNHSVLYRKGGEARIHRLRHSSAVWASGSS